MRLSAIFSILISLALCGCGLNAKQNAGATGGMIGTAAGAGTGALIGAAIADGDVAMSALLGGGIGLPLGVLAGVAYFVHQEETELEKNDEEISRNREEILARQQVIDTLRQKSYDESSGIMLDANRNEYLYNGPSLGVPTR